MSYSATADVLHGESATRTRNEEHKEFTAKGGKDAEVFLGKEI
jgi:hypothetical protein